MAGGRRDVCGVLVVDGGLLEDGLFVVRLLRVVRRSVVSALRLPLRFSVLLDGVEEE